MTSIPAGAKVRASDINNSLPLMGYAVADSTKTSNTTLADATGVVVALQANSTYILDGYIAYNAGATGDLKVAWTVPAGTTGHWGLYPIAVASTASVGDLDARRIDAYGDANIQAGGGSDSFGGIMVALPRGYIVTSGTAGNFQLRFAQNTSSVTSTVIKIGTWIRVLKVA